MPTYEYKCKKCDHLFELWQEVGADAPECPECGAEVQKVFRPIRTIFKGSGFYVNDSRPVASKSSDTSDAKESKTETKTESAEKPTPDAKPSEPKESSGEAKKDSPGKVS